MSETDISTAAVERLLDGVTAGPWTRHGTTSDGAKFVGKMHRIQADGAWMAFIATWESSSDEAAEAEANTDFIAASRNLVPALLADRDRLAADVARLTEALRSEHGISDALAEAASLALNSHGCTRLSYPPQDPWIFRNVSARLGQAIAAHAERREGEA